MSGVTVTGPFSQTNTCTAAVAPGASCTISVTFTPVLLGSASGTLTITGNAGTQPVSLSGTGSNPVSLSPASLSFGNMAVGETSAAKTVTLTNRLSTALALSGVTITGPFAISANTCGTSVAAAGTCTVSVAFTPPALGSATGVLTFSDSAVTSPQTVNLTGNGSAPVTLSASSLNFNSVVVGTTSAVRTVTLTNAQSMALSITSVATNGTFAIASNNCGTSLAAGARCTVGVTFLPVATGPATGTLTFTDSVASPQTVSLSGTGTAPVTLSTGSLNFGIVTVGTTSSVKNVTLTNRMSTSLTFSGMAASTGFAVASNNCGATVAAGANCTVGVTFNPIVSGAAVGALTFTDSAGNSPQVVNLSGTGQ